MPVKINKVIAMIMGVVFISLIAEFVRCMDPLEQAVVFSIEKGTNLLGKLYTKLRYNPTAELLQGIQDTNSEMVHHALENGASLLERDQQGNNLLHLIADGARKLEVETIEQNKYVQILTIIKEHNSEQFNKLLAETNNQGEIPLHRAVWNTGGPVSCLEVVSSLISEDGKSWNCQDSNTITPLHYAMRSTTVDLLRLVTGKSASPEVRQSARSYIDEAISYNNPLTLEYMLSRGWFINALGLDVHGKCFLETIDMSSQDTDIIAKRREIIETLLAYGAYLPPYTNIYDLLSDTMKDYFTWFELQIITHVPAQVISENVKKSTKRSFALAVAQGNPDAVKIMLPYYIDLVPPVALNILYKRLKYFAKVTQTVTIVLNDQLRQAYRTILEQFFNPYMDAVEKFLASIESVDLGTINVYITNHQNNHVSPWAPRFSVQVMRQAREIINKLLEDKTLTEDKRKQLDIIKKLLIQNTSASANQSNNTITIVQATPQTNSNETVSLSSSPSSSSNQSITSGDISHTKSTKKKIKPLEKIKKIALLNWWK